MADTKKDDNVNTKKDSIVVERIPQEDQGPQYTESELARQELQRQQVQDGIDAQDLARQQMAAETKLREARDAKAKKSVEVK